MKRLMKVVVTAVFALIVTGSVAFAGTEVSKIEDGSWVVAQGQSGSIYDIWQDLGFWVDVKVQNIAYNKIVGIRWTDDNWATYTDSYLTYEATIDSTYERWGISFAPLGRIDTYYIGGWHNYITDKWQAGGITKTIQYALFYTVNGVTYWDNNNGQNYSYTMKIIE